LPSGCIEIINSELTQYLYNNNGTTLGNAVS
jgi:hypothetical protein